MYRNHHRLRVILLSLGVVFGFGSGIAHVAGYHHRHHHAGHDCSDSDWSWDRAPWSSTDKPAQNGAPPANPVQ